MNILSRDSLQEGGFAGLREHRIVTDSRVFGARKPAFASEGLGNFVYLADARFNPRGETGMHPHKEIDVISVMVNGRVSHAGSLEHGKSLNAGDAQVQRAGGEGFSHNEINPDDTKNRMIQLWVVPEEEGQPAGYKYYSPENYGVTRIYGGSKNQNETFDSSTYIDIVRLQKGESYELPGTQLSYITEGHAQITENGEASDSKDGDLIQSTNATVKALSELHIINIHAKA